MAKGKINYGKKDLLPPGPIKPSDETIRISMWMEGDLLDALKSAAAKEGIGYQTLMKRIVRQQLLGEQDPSADMRSRLERIEEALGFAAMAPDRRPTVAVRAKHSASLPRSRAKNKKNAG